MLKNLDMKGKKIEKATVGKEHFDEFGQSIEIINDRSSTKSTLSHKRRTTIEDYFG